MSDEITINISIPADNDGFVLLQCSHCVEFFKLTAHDYEDDSILYIYCPACGLISENYLTEEVFELANIITKNIANDVLYNGFKQLERKNSSRNPVKFKAGKKPKHEYENPIRSRIDELQIKQYACCKRSAKIKPLLNMSASHCPFCGVINFANE